MNMNNTKGRKKCHKANLKAEQLKSLRSRRKNRCRDVNQENAFFAFVSSQSRTFFHSSHTIVVRFCFRPSLSWLFIIQCAFCKLCRSKRRINSFLEAFSSWLRTSASFSDAKVFSFNSFVSAGCNPTPADPSIATRTPDTRRRTQKCEVKKS